MNSCWKYALVLLLWTLTAQAAPPAELLGTWKTTKPVYEEVDGQLFMQIQFKKDDTFVFTSLCEYKRGTVTVPVSVTSRLEIRENRIKTLDTQKKQVQEDGGPCIVQVEPVEVEFSVQGNRLTLDYLNKDGDLEVSFELQRVK